MKKFLRGLFLMAASVLCLAPQGVGALGGSGTARVTGATQPSITRTIQNVSNAVTVEFGYNLSVVADSPTQAEDLNLPENVTVSFNNVAPSNGVATASSVLDLSGLTFTEVGDYKIAVQEVSSSDPDNYPVDSANTYHILVSVRNDSGLLNIFNRGMTATVLSQVGLPNGDKTEQMLFSGSTTMTYLTLKKQVRGNMGQMDRYFRFEYSFNNLPNGTILAINGQDETIEYDGQTLRTQDELVVGETNYIYLKNGQSATIGLSDGVGQVPIGTRYYVSEQDVPDGYSVFIDGATSSALISAEKTAVASSWADGDTAAEEAFNSQNKTSYVNERESAVATGVATIILPFAVIAAVAIVGGCVYYNLAKRK